MCSHPSRGSRTTVLDRRCYGRRQEGPTSMRKFLVSDREKPLPGPTWQGIATREHQDRHLRHSADWGLALLGSGSAISGRKHRDVQRVGGGLRRSSLPSRVPAAFRPRGVSGPGARTAGPGRAAVAVRLHVHKGHADLRGRGGGAFGERRPDDARTRRWTRDGHVTAMRGQSSHVERLPGSIGPEHFVRAKLALVFH